jgi:hypothetical protein
MEDKQIKEILEDPQKLLNFMRLLHQLLHIYDQKEMEKEIQRKGGTNETAGLADTVSIVLKDNKGNIKQENERRSK